VEPHPMQKWQHITTFVGMSLGFYKWFVVDFFNFWSGNVGSVYFHVQRRDWYRLLFFKSLWVVTHVIPSLYYLGFGRTMGLMAVYMILGAQYLENIFIVNHIQEDLAHPPQTAHWANKQVLASCNWAAGSTFWNWFSGGLNHQIEHHLFPAISIYLYPSISQIVRDTCKEFNLPYHSYSSFPRAWLAMVCYTSSSYTHNTYTILISYRIAPASRSHARG
jgi:fatty acid desaturase